MPKPTLRELSRQAVKQRVSDVAIDLFLERGYESTTVEDIAAAAGISERSFFRYFATKDAVFFARGTEYTAAFIERVLERPAGEAPWLSLQTAVELTLTSFDNDVEFTKAREVREILAASPELMARQFAHVADSQRELGDALWDRWQADPARHTEDPEIRLVIRALVGSMLGVLTEVMLHAEDLPPAERMRLVRATLDAIRPARADLGGAP